jgi:hypothetical protein
MPSGRSILLAFAPKEEARAVAAFPEAVYRFYSIDETHRLLTEAGFQGLTMSSEPIKRGKIVFGVGYR